VNRIVLDASALLTVLLQERGAEKLSVELLGVAVISAVNLAEVHSKLVLRGAKPHDAWQASVSVVREVVPFNAEQARAVGDLCSQTHSLGLALGDRACLALGITLNAPIYTADKSWTKVGLAARIHIIR
jgi:ribonuclease VapC